MSEPKPKKCQTCKGTEGRMKVDRKYQKKDGSFSYYYVCYECNNKWQRDYLKRKGTAFRAETYRKTYQKHKEKWLARAKVNYAER